MPLPSKELLDELYARFILNLPTGELESPERMMFVIEEAHWFYEDHYRETDPSLKSLTLKEFTKLVFERCPGLESYQHLTDQIYKHFQAFKITVPCMGGILLDPSMNYVLLLKGVKSGAAWGFPRGKIGKDERDEDCCVREVLEETSFDVSGRVVPEDFIETVMGPRRIKLYIITDVPLDTPFAPQMKGEIGAYAWHEVNHLPTTKDEFATSQYMTEDGSRHKFFMVWPFVKKLKTFIKKRRKALRSQSGPAVREKKATAASEQPTAAPAPEIPGPLHSADGKKGRRRKKKSRAAEDCQAAEQAVAAPIASAVDEPQSVWGVFKLDHGTVLGHLEVSAL
mmetsp:Transcript_22155/g.61495  ORF Transcript_22155/g.61495 Transcript_22155/m.61495 type:complete len:339 (-) Transcript_22155:74-1090(-)|eukprot:CAMPEP_0117670920 /NCGR_PEP_ID=MMETSP0804-20121206/13040_1 /TAXON_ID=1074897 /ORGANISM="Tetraselmis astigmatica, Strain CCMP880" /LENGTH=338 /DNA_ID=CAMNT_0005479311 /DNA_START=430 /DNA_END=1446 /DNA_ORIENTATION=-